jgi:HAD superfamily hydrolase (TIGR01509 family)
MRREPVSPTTLATPFSPDVLPDPPADPPAELPAAVLWDMDGTLVDTEPYWIECEFALVAAHGGTWSSEQAHGLVGNDLTTSARQLQRHGPVPLDPEQIIDTLLDGVCERVGRAVPWRPGARELLAALGEAGVPNALVTMSYRRLAESVVSNLPDGSFATLVTGDEVSRGKPAPDPYLAAAARLGVPPAACVAIEDSPTGIASARAAGVPVIGVEHLVPLAAHSADAVLRSLHGVTPAQLRRLTRAPSASMGARAERSGSTPHSAHAAAPVTSDLRDGDRRNRTGRRV